MKYTDYYEVLGVERTATLAQIKSAYRKLARKYHPDVSSDPAGEEKFKRVGEAYAVLKDPEKRAAYDQLGSQWKEGQEFNPPPDWGAGFEFQGGARESADLSDLFESLFGQAGYRRGSERRQGASARGEDHHAKVAIDVEDSLSGATRSITLQAPELDSAGRLQLRPRTLNVRIPRGIVAGQQIRLTGQGAPGFGGGSAGDLYLQVEFSPHRWYRVDGRDLLLVLPVAPWEAALGATVRVPAPGGLVAMKIPENTSAGRRMRLKGKGIPATPPGDLIVEVKIVLPAARTAAAKALYRQMREQLDFNPRQSFEETRSA